MSLQGSLETFSLPDVLRLLAATDKTGELQVATGRGSGQVWMKDGKVVGGSVGRALESVDAVFELLRSDNGSFTFVADRQAVTAAPGEDVEDVLAEAEARLVEWREIEAVVPSMQVRAALAPTAPNPVATMTAEQWLAIVAVSKSTTVEGVMDHLEMGEFVTCKTIKGLVELGLVVLDTNVPQSEQVRFVAEEAAEVPAVQAPDAGESTPLLRSLDPAMGEDGVGEDGVGGDDDTVERWQEIARLAELDEDEMTDAERARASELMEEAGAIDGTEPINRGVLLKFLSSVRN